MARRSLTREEQEQIVALYEGWDPDDGRSSADLIAEAGVSRQTFYDVLQRAGVQLKSRRTQSDVSVSGLHSEVGAAVLDRLEQANEEIRRLRQQVAVRPELSVDDVRLADRLVAGLVAGELGIEAFSRSELLLAISAVVVDASSDRRRGLISLAGLVTV